MENTLTASNSLDAGASYDLCHQELQEDKRIANSEKLNIALYLTSKIASLLGTNIYNFALSLYILKMTGSGISFAINLLTGLLPRILLGPVAGIAADRVNRKKLTIILDIASSIIVFTLLGISAISGLKVGYIYTAGLLLSTVSVFYDTALTASLPNLVRDKNLMKINSFTTVSSSLSGILAPILGGVIFGLVPINLFLLVNAISFVFSAGQELFIDFDLNKASGSRGAASIRSFRSELNEVLAFVKTQKTLYILLKYSLVVNFFIFAAMSVIYPFIINKVLKMTSSQFGILEAFFSIGILTASIIVGSRKEKNGKISKIASCLLIMGCIFILAGVPTLGAGIFTITPLLMGYNIVLLIAMGTVMVMVNTPIMVMLQRNTPDNLRGRLMGILGTLTGGIAPLGIIMAGVAIDRVHPFILMLLSGIIIILSTLKLFGDKTLKEF